MKNFLNKYYKKIIMSIVIVLIYVIHIDKLTNLNTEAGLVPIFIIPMIWGCFYYSIGIGLGMIGGLIYFNSPPNPPHYYPSFDSVYFMICASSIIFGIVLQIVIPIIIKKMKKTVR